MSLGRIDTTEDLRRYLQTALQLEHATIPPYLVALYSIRPMTNGDAARILRVVVVEEMLHLTLVANLINAVGGEPDLTASDFVPHYPTHLPDGETDFEVGLQPFSPTAIETFMRIERPASGVEGKDLVERARSPRALLPAVTGRETGAEMHFRTIGEFYREIERGLRHLDASLTQSGEALFSGDPARQVTPDFYYSGGGELISVDDLESACAAIRLITEQGEGVGGAIYDYESELSHYYRFEQLVLGRYYQPGDEAGKPTGPRFDVDWDGGYPVKVDAGLGDYRAGSELHEAALLFSRVYHSFLARLTEAFNGNPRLLMPAVGDMFRIKELATQLIRSPIPGGEGMHALPLFVAASPGEV